MPHSQILNPFVSPEQERLRELVFALYKEEQPLDPMDLATLEHFVVPVREEFVENTTPGQRSIRRITYFMLNDIGRQMYQRWLKGEIDPPMPPWTAA